MTQKKQHTAEVIPLVRESILSPHPSKSPIEQHVSWCCVQLVLFSIVRFVDIASWSCAQLVISDEVSWSGFKLVAEQILWLSVMGLVQQTYERWKGFITLEHLCNCC